MGGIIPLTLIGIVYTLDLLNIEYLVTTRPPCLGEGRYWVGGGGGGGRMLFREVGKRGLDNGCPGNDQNSGHKKRGVLKKRSNRGPIDGCQEVVTLGAQ